MGLCKKPELHVIDDIVTLMNKFTISATMSFRAWLPIRNSFQPFFTLAPRIGNDVVIEAMKRASKNGDEIVQRLKAAGKIPDRAPINNIIGGDDKLWIDKFNNKGMNAYQSSDAWTRAVVDQSVDILMEDSAERLTKGLINEKQFLDMSGINQMSELKQLEIMRALKNGDYLRAKDIYSDHLIWETMFPYKTGTNPTAFHGVFGRLFGGFGHYPVYYTTNILRGLRNMPGTKKAAFAARVVGNSLAIYNVFKEVLGIDAKAFLFYTPTNFTGGPLYDIFNTALEAGDASYYEGKIARKMLPGKIASVTLPGAQLTQDWLEAIKELNNGNLHGFIVNGMSAPLNDNF
jgi:hypothetical protein